MMMSTYIKLSLNYHRIGRGHESYDTALLFTILEIFPKLEYIKINYCNTEGFEEIFAEYRSKSFTTKLKKIELWFSRYSTPQDKESKEFYEWLRQVCPELKQLVLDEKTIAVPVRR
jgi:hypothetical protein